MPRLEVNGGFEERIPVFNVSKSTVKTLLKPGKTRVLSFIFYFIHDTI